jgi:hexosaminidase
MTVVRRLERAVSSAPLCYSASMFRRISIVVVVCAVAASCSRNAAPKVAPASSRSAPVRQALTLLPLPESIEGKTGEFQLGGSAIIYIEREAFRGSAQFLSDFIGLAFGAPLRVELSPAGAPGSILIRKHSAGAPLGAEGYVLSISKNEIVIDADAAAGAFYAVQTLRQLLPPPFEYEALRAPRRNAPLVAVPAVEIQDRPRFSWRGAMLDVARHFLRVDEVKRYIDLMALHKLNRLHLHLADDQGWRIQIDSWPNLTVHGGSTEVGGGPGGFYTKADYADIVKYAAERFITIVPEIDMPGHTNAALASYGELNCDGAAKPLFTGTEVGFSAFCVEKEVIYTFIDDVVREIAALTPGPYFHVGGDEVKTLTPEQYQGFINRVQTIVRAHGKQMVGWDEIAPANLLPSSIVQHWRPKTTPKEAVAKGAKVILSVASKAYLDMKYDDSTPIGLTWAGIVSVQASYDWDPATATEGVEEAAILGVEAPLWGETIANIRDYEFLAFPRLAALAEVGWSPQAARTWEEFRERLGAQNSRWTALGLNFYRSPEVPWRIPNP